MHAVTVDSRPTATLTVVSTQGPVPSSITTSGYNIVLTNIARSHSGMYTLRATNTYGSDSEMFTVDVQCKSGISAAWVLAIWQGGNSKPFTSYPAWVPNEHCLASIKTAISIVPWPQVWFSSLHTESVYMCKHTLL